MSSDLESHLDYQIGITETMIEEAKSWSGMAIRVEPWNHEASLDSIRHYSWGIGDGNPIFCDEAAAANSVHGEIVAPPTFLYSVFDGAIGLGFVGLQPIYAGTTWKFARWVRRGERITPHARLGEVHVRKGRHAPRFVIQDVVTEYRDAEGALIAEAIGRTFRVPRALAPGGLSYEAREPKVYAPDELDAIRYAAVSEPVQGATPRYWEDVNVGDLIPQVVKGPIDQITMTAYYAGCPGSPGYKACEMAWKYRTWARDEPERLPNNYDPTYFSETVLPSLGHQNPRIAREIGMPGAYNNGPQKCGWMAHAVTNWMGDHGFIRELNLRLRRPDVYGDTVFIGGTVIDKLEPQVTIALRATNHLGEQTAEGTAVVLLPKR